jgi:hypothetical protein
MTSVLKSQNPYDPQQKDEKGRNKPIGFIGSFGLIL